MKKSFLVASILIVTLALISVGCSSGNPSPTTNQTSIPPTTSSPAGTTTSPSAATFTLTLIIEGGGQITPSAGKYTYPKGTVVNLSAIGDIHWTFNVWLGSVADSRSATTTITMNSDQTVTAFFSATMD